VSILTIKVRVEEVLKGKGNPAEVITISSPGGLKIFSSSTSALVQVPDFRQPRNGRRYAFFLDDGSHARGSFKMTAGFQGAFELPGDGSDVKGSDRRTSNSLLMGKVRKANTASFMMELKSSIKD